MINDNKGNPYHDESGKFTSKGGEGAGGAQPKSDPIVDFNRSLWDMYFGGQPEAPKKTTGEKVLNQMGLSNEEIMEKHEEMSDEKALNDLGEKMDKLENGSSNQDNPENAFDNNIEEIQSYIKELHDQINYRDRDHQTEDSQKWEVDNIAKNIADKTGEKFKLVNSESIYGGSDSEGSWYYPTYELESDNYKLTVSFSGGYKQYVTMEIEPKEEQNKALNQMGLNENDINENNPENVKKNNDLDENNPKYDYIKLIDDGENAEITLPIELPVYNDGQGGEDYEVDVEFSELMDLLMDKKILSEDEQNEYINNPKVSKDFINRIVDKYYDRNEVYDWLLEQSYHQAEKSRERAEADRYDFLEMQGKER